MASGFYALIIDENRTHNYVNRQYLKDTHLFGRIETECQFHEACQLLKDSRDTAYPDLIIMNIDQSVDDCRAFLESIASLPVHSIKFLTVLLLGQSPEPKYPELLEDFDFIFGYIQHPLDFKIISTMFKQKFIR
jgi:CheY-like chemotaxis protein